MMLNCPKEIKLEAQAIAQLITNSKQLSQKKRPPEWQDSNKCMCRRQYISMLLWTFGLKEAFVKWEALPLPIFVHPGYTLGIYGRNHYQNGSIPSKAFCL